MGMTIDKAISWLLSIAEHEGDDIPIYDTDVEAIKMGIDTMRKYQKIQEIVEAWREVGLNYDSCDAMENIEKVTEPYKEVSE